MSLFYARATLRNITTFFSCSSIILCAKNVQSCDVTVSFVIPIIPPPPPTSEHARLRPCVLFTLFIYTIFIYYTIGKLWRTRAAIVENWLDFQRCYRVGGPLKVTKLNNSMLNSPISLPVRILIENINCTFKLYFYKTRHECVTHLLLKSYTHYNNIILHVYTLLYIYISAVRIVLFIYFIFWQTRTPHVIRRYDSN